MRYLAALSIGLGLTGCVGWHRGTSATGATAPAGSPSAPATSSPATSPAEAPTGAAESATRSSPDPAPDQAAVAAQGSVAGASADAPSVADASGTAASARSKSSAGSQRAASSGTSARAPTAGAPTKSAPAASTAAKAAPAAAAPAQPPALDLTALEQRLRSTNAIGVFTKLSLKNQVDQLLGQVRAFHGGKLPPTLAQLRQQYDLLLMKVLSLLQDGDPPLAKAISSSREAIWGMLADPQKFSKIDS